MQLSAPLGMPAVSGPHAAPCPAASWNDPEPFKAAVAPQAQAIEAEAEAFWTCTKDLATPAARQVAEEVATAQPGKFRAVDEAVSGTALAPPM